jgi:hypothetical protein
MSQRKVDELVETINPEQVCMTKVDRGVRQRRALKTTLNINTKALIQEDGRITAFAVADMLNIRQLETAIPNKRRGLLSKTVLLHYGSAIAHISAATIQTIRNLKIEVLKHPSYCPELAR